VGKYNKTQLYIDKAEDRGIVHRDYLAHCLRWTHILRHAKMGMKILDVGCGINYPLAWMLYTNKFKPDLYVGLDIRSDFEEPEFNFKCELFPVFDVTNSDHWLDFEKEYPESFNIITCLEVIEHMEKEDGLKLLENLSLLPSSSTIFLSTPCYNGSKAANHIYEWEYVELREELRKNFTIEFMVRSLLRGIFYLLFLKERGKFLRVLRNITTQTYSRFS